MRSHGRGAAGAAATALAAAATLGACAVNPATGERELALIGEAQEIEMGRDADRQVVGSIGLYPDSAMQRYVRGLGESLAAASERPDLPWTFRVLDDASVNAFALPGGFIYMTRGILSHMRSEAELVGVLGHEIGHVTARHSVSQISRAQLAQLGVGLGMVLVPELRPFADLAGAGLELLFLRFSRDDERQADELGVRYMRRLDYDPRELASVFRMLARTGGGQGRLPEWLSTHPDPADREQHILRMAEAEDLSSAIVRREAYLRRLDGMVFGDDPREGFFSDGLFHHPDLEFRMRFPAGWTTANMKHAVQGVSQGRDAAIVLTLSPEQDVRTALAAFARQEGIALGRTWEESVNGLPAGFAEFRAHTEGGDVEGVVMFVSHGGRLYRVLGYAPQARWPAQSGTVRASLASFARETDARVLAVEPRRLELVELSQTLAFQQFLERYPSTAPPEVVALINHVEPGASLPAGMLAKRVVGGRLP